jgi:hypothetical protein
MIINQYDHESTGTHVTNLTAPSLKRMPVSVTRKMSASLPGLRKMARDKGLTRDILLNMKLLILHI